MTITTFLIFAGVFSATLFVFHFSFFTLTTVPSSGFPLQDYYSRIYRTYDLVNRLFTFGLDERWRRHTVKECLACNPREILDLCCGTGDLAIRLAKASADGVHITGYDLNPHMLEMARTKAKKSNVTDVDFLQGDAGALPFCNQSFDCITIGFGFRNLTWENPAGEKHILEISRVMKPGARLFIIESAVPENRLVRLLYRMYLRIVLVPLGGLISGSFKAYHYLAGSSAGFYSTGELSRMLAACDLTLHSCKKYLFGSVNLLVATRPVT